MRAECAAVAVALRAVEWRRAWPAVEWRRAWPAGRGRMRVGARTLVLEWPSLLSAA